MTFQVFLADKAQRDLDAIPSKQADQVRRFYASAVSPPENPHNQRKDTKKKPLNTIAEQRAAKMAKRKA